MNVNHGFELVRVPVLRLIDTKPPPRQNYGTVYAGTSPRHHKQRRCWCPRTDPRSSRRDEITGADFRCGACLRKSLAWLNLANTKLSMAAIEAFRQAHAHVHVVAQ